MEVRPTNLGASAYSTPVFEPASVVASAPTFFQRVAAWLTRPVSTLDLASAEEFDPMEHMRALDEEISSRLANPDDIYGYRGTLDD